MCPRKYLERRRCRQPAAGRGQKKFFAGKASRNPLTPLQAKTKTAAPMPIPSNFTNMVFALVAVTFLSAVSLAFVYEWTKEPIAKARLATQLKAIEAVLPGCDNNPVEEQFYVRYGSDSLAFFPGSRAGQPVGVAVKSKSAKGYSGDIWLMVGFDTAGVIKNIVVVAHNETPGLGSKMTGGKFLKQFINANPATTDLRMKKDGGTLDAISGATISARAFSEAVQTAFNSYQSHGKEN